MANEKQINSRIQHKHDTEANWNTAGTATNPFIPKVGELIIYDPDNSHSIPRIKIGNGSSNIKDLPFVTNEYATEGYVNNAISAAITTVLNTEV